MKGRVVVLCVLFCAICPALCFPEGDVENLKQFEYWENGKIKQCTVYDVEGHLKSKAFCRSDGTVEKMEKFDPYGNKIEEALYDQKGRLKLGVDGWAAIRWWYEGPQLVSQILYDEDGIPLERKQYSESGKLVLRQYRDELDLNPYEGAQMYMMLGGRNVPYELIKRENAEGGNH